MGIGRGQLWGPHILLSVPCVWSLPILSRSLSEPLSVTNKSSRIKNLEVIRIKIASIYFYISTFG